MGGERIPVGHLDTSKSKLPANNGNNGTKDYSFLFKFRDGEVKETPTIENQIKREMMIPGGQRRMETQEDHQDEMIQMMTLMVMMMMTLQMVLATQHQAAIIHIDH